MEINDIINDAVHYPISDIRKFLILGLPNLVLSILFFILILQSIGLTTLSDLPAESIVSSPLFSTFILTTLIFFIALILGIILIEGIQLSIIRETIRGNNELPSIEFGKNFVDGLKITVLSIVYIGIPTIVFLILLMASVLIAKDNSGILIIILTILFIIAVVIITMILTVSLGRLAETDSLSEALNFGKIYEIAKIITFKNILIVLVACTILNLIISAISSLIGAIPIIGFFIISYILYTYYLIASSRSYGLLYRNYLNGDYSNNTKPDNNYLPTNDIDNDDVNNEQLDYQPTKEIPENNQENVEFINCKNCGYSNPKDVKFCLNCGNEF